MDESRTGSWTHSFPGGGLLPWTEAGAAKRGAGSRCALDMEAGLSVELVLAGEREKDVKGHSHVTGSSNEVGRGPCYELGHVLGKARCGREGSPTCSFMKPLSALGYCPSLCPQMSLWVQKAMLSDTFN